jgi:hypothetical protein
LAGQTHNANIGPCAKNTPFPATAGMLFSQLNDIVDLDVKICHGKIMDDAE